MRFSREDLTEIVEKASTITESLSSDFYLDKNQEDEELANKRLDEWCQIVSNGDWSKFESHLKHLHLDVDKARQVTSMKKIINSLELPKWCETLNEAIESTASIDAQDLSSELPENFSILKPSHPLPFEDLLLLFINVARKKLKLKADLNYYLLSQQAHINLERYLLARLAYICGPALELEFSIFRQLSKSKNIFSKKNRENPSSSNKFYKEFTKKMLTGGFVPFFKKYSVLARLVCHLVEVWVDSNKEFLQRLDSDLPEIRNTFFKAKEIKKVTNIQPGLSDCHNNGRCVMEVHFDSDLKLIYKPKDLGLERAYFNFLSWLNQQSILLPLKVIKFIERSEYGWVEFVEYIPCEKEEELKRYYYRSGMLICLAYVLEAVDLHNENIIACSEDPVLIDLETLAHPRIKEVNNQGEPLEIYRIAYQQISHSVVWSGLLPQWYSLLPETQACEGSGLGGFFEQKTPLPVRQWSHINTDSMTVKYDYIVQTPKNNLPILKGTKVGFANFAHEIISGFKSMYDLFVQKKDYLLQEDSPLAEFSSQKVRLVLRSTHAYSTLLEKLNHPIFLKNGVAQSIQIDAMSKALLSSDFASQFYPLVEEEKKALHRLDIPIIIANSDSSSLKFENNKVINDCFSASSFSNIMKRIRSLNDEDLEQNISFIEGLFYSHIPSSFSHSSPSQRDDFGDKITPSATQEEIQRLLIQESVIIGNILEKRAIRSQDSSATWIAPQYDVNISKYKLTPLAFNLFEGSLGVALFLAAVGRIANKTNFIELSLSSLKPLLLLLKEENFEHFSQAIGVTGTFGCSSIIYALVQIGKILDESTLLDAAKQIAAMIKPELITADKQFDVIGGVAGTILSLIALYDILPAQALENQIATCGHHLLNNRVHSDSGYRSWQTSDGKLLTGFSHGASGIAYALLRLYQVTNQSVFLEAAQESLAYERSVFNSEVGNWPDFRFSSTDSDLIYQCDWSHGASGIGLARIAGLNILDTDEIRQDIEIAIKTTISHGLSNVDHLCNGNLGRVEFLFTAAQKLSQPQLQEIAIAQTAQIIARKQQKGNFGYDPFLSFYPGFFKGAAGIGYEFLRLAYPDLLPSVLLLE
jgi:type 2 lantibiotic biosynthesis protein LanM